MEYEKLRQRLLERGYERVERDDRLLDVFPTEIREKGIELWEKSDRHQVSFVRLHLLFHKQRISIFSIPSATIADALRYYYRLDLALFEQNKSLSFLP